MYRFIFIISLFAGLKSSNAQVFHTYSEFGLFAGGASYIGELNPGNPFYMIRPAAGVLYRYSTSPRFSWRFMFNAARLEASDANSGIAYQELRNLSFRSNVYEAGAMLEFNFFPFESGDMSYIATPYLAIGLSGFYSNPKALFNNEWVVLRSLSTEGQGSAAYRERKVYSRFQPAMPFGMGVRLNIIPRLTLSAEWIMRKTFTDYIDDVSTTYADPDLLVAENGAYAALLADRSVSNPGRSNVNLQRGNPSTKDWFSTAGLILTFSFSSRKPGCSAYQ
jgi:hypothetical protein